ncbi:MAG: shikimate dehydrogenase [Candidatus Omnitrophica bacterium]|nr:shikimate dehydrogenase [Candidatus Omnitrophota bacterium]
MSTTEKQNFGLIGCPVSHSLSPLMHNAAFQALGINGEYQLFELKAEEVESFVRSLGQRGLRGINVTIPYKEKIIPFLDRLTPQAGLIGAVNTIKNTEGKLEGFNTDGDGFIRHLKDDMKFIPEGKKIAVIGAGGASRAISVCLAQNKVRQIIIYDVDQKRSLALAELLKRAFKDNEFIITDSTSGLKIEEADLLVNTSPVGMKKNDPIIVDPRFLHPGMLVYDIIYNPAQTRLLEMAREKGAAATNGLGMLLYQGVLAFEIWTGQKAPVEIMRQALNEGAKKI